MGYSAFISYSHTDDARSARALEKDVEQFGKRWNQARARDLFRDSSDEGISADLGSTIEQALEESQWLILLASPAAAASPWVDREARVWIDRKSESTILIVLTGGHVAWDESSNAFAPETDAVPESLKRHLRHEPLFFDLREAKAANELSLRHEQYLDGVASIVAKLEGCAKSDIYGEHLRQQRRTMRLARGAITTLVVLALLAGVGALVAMRNARRADSQAARADAARREAEQLARVSLARAVAAESLARVPNDPQLALLLAAEAHNLSELPETKGALYQTLAQEDRLDSIVRPTSSGHRVWLSSAGSTAALREATVDGVTLTLVDLRGPLDEGRRVALPSAVTDFNEVLFSADGALAAVLWLDDDFGSSSFVLIETSTGLPLSSPRHISGHVFAISPDGRTLYGLSEGAIEAVNTRSGHRVTNRLFPEERTPPNDYDHLALSDDGSIGIAASGYLVAVFPTDSLAANWSTRTRTPIHAVAVEPQARQFSILTGPSGEEWATVRAFDLSSGSEVWSNMVPYVTQFGNYDPRPGVLRYSPDHQRLAISMGYEDADVSRSIGEQGGTLVLGVDGSFVVGPVPGRFADFDDTGATMATTGPGRGTAVWDLEHRSAVGLPYRVERDPNEGSLAIPYQAVLVDEDFLVTSGTVLRRWRRGPSPALAVSPMGGPFVYAVAADPGAQWLAVSRGVPYRGLPAEASETVLVNARTGETRAYSSKVRSSAPRNPLS